MSGNGQTSSEDQNNMVKMVNFFKRRSDLSFEEFRNIYETSHARLGDRVLQGRAIRYVRRYLYPVTDLETGQVFDGDYDVLTEVWFRDREAFEEAWQYLASPDVIAEIVPDEETLFDRSKSRCHLVEECESWIS